MPQRADRDLRQVVVVQPEVAQLLKAFEAVVGNGHDVVGVQTAAGEGKANALKKKKRLTEVDLG